jgi:hypothetical protein
MVRAFLARSDRLRQRTRRVDHVVEQQHVAAGDFA